MLVEGPLAGQSLGIGHSIFKDMFLYLKHKHKYVKELDENFTKLHNRVDLLRADKKDINEMVERDAILKTKQMNNRCKFLLDQIEKTSEEFEKLKSQYHDARKFETTLANPQTGNQFDESIENLQTRNEDVPKPDEALENLQTKNKNVFKQFFKLAKLSKNIVKRTVQVDELLREVKCGDLMTMKKPEAVEMKHASEIDAQLHNEHIKKLLEHLRDDCVKIIGIWGPPGVGKTTILKNLNDKLNQLITGKKYELNHYVFYVDVRKKNSGEDSVRKIQQEILGRLNLSEEDANSSELVADRISRALQDMKYTLLLNLDCSVINLSDVGIRNNHKHGKVVVASEHKSVSRNMKVDEVIEVKGLSKAEAEKLFRKNVGNVLDNRRLEVIADRILNELGGLPEAIKLIASFLKDESGEFVWNGTLWQLQSYNEQAELQHLAGLYHAYKLVYNQFFDYTKKCLLYGALFPKDYEICKDYLMECWRAERFIPDDQTAGNLQAFRMARDKGHLILRDLTDACLLEWCSRKEYVKMPRLFRNMALSFPYPQEGGCRSLVKVGEHIQEHPAEEEWTNAKRISLMCTMLDSLPESPDCRNISTLLLQWNAPLTTIPKSFFARMGGLQILDLQHTGIESLPTSIDQLTNLKGLYLNNCPNLVTLAIEIFTLKHLEVLDLQDTGIWSLPVEIQQLVGLRCLRISFIYNSDNGSGGVMIPPNIVKNIPQLEELTILVDPKEQSWNNIVNGIAKEIASLRALTTLFFYFPKVSSLETFITNSVSWNNINTRWGDNTFRAFKIRVGSLEADHPHGLDISGSSADRSLRFSADEAISPAVGMVLKQASAFQLIGHPNAGNLSVFGLENMESLEICIIQECKGMGSIVDGNLQGGGAAFQAMKKLHIINLRCLNCVWNGKVNPGSLSHLTTLTLNGCPVLNKILSPELTPQLSQLQHLRVENCCAIIKIIEDEIHRQEVTETVNLSGTLPKLKIIELFNLQKLVSICKSDSLKWLALEKIVIEGCMDLSNLSLSTSNAQQLKSIECNKQWWNGLNLKEEVKRRLDDLCRFPLSEYGGATLEEEEGATLSFTHHHPPNSDGHANDVEVKMMDKHACNSLREDGGWANGASSSSCLPIFPG